EVDHDHEQDQTRDPQPDRERIDPQPIHEALGLRTPGLGGISPGEQTAGDAPRLLKIAAFERAACRAQLRAEWKRSCVRPMRRVLGIGRGRFVLVVGLRVGAQAALLLPSAAGVAPPLHRSPLCWLMVLARGSSWRKMWIAS